MTSETKMDAASDAVRARGSDGTRAPHRGGGALALSLAWLAVGIPLLWGVVQTLRRSLALFG